MLTWDFKILISGSVLTWLLPPIYLVVLMLFYSNYRGTLETKQINENTDLKNMDLNQ